MEENKICDVDKCELMQELLEYQETMEKGKQEMMDANSKLERYLNESNFVVDILESLSTVKSTDSLLSELGDMLLGLIGTYYCTILLNNGREYEIKYTNRNVDYSIVKKDLHNIFVDIYKPTDITSMECIFGEDEEYSKSTIMIPLVDGNGKRKAIIIMEHDSENYFDEDKLRLLKQIHYILVLLIENSQIYEELNRAAIYDKLTGVHNRAHFDTNLPQLVDRSYNLGEEFAVAMFDIDKFKTINDTYGHPEGDIVLQELAKIIKSSIRPQDIFCRMGGDEFTIMFCKLKDIDVIEKRVDQIRQKIENYKFEVRPGLVIPVRCSFGIAYSKTIKETTEIPLKDIMKYSDEALYWSKRAGRNTVSVYSKEKAEKIALEETNK